MTRTSPKGPNLKKRLQILQSLFLVVLLGISGKAFYVQVVDNENMELEARNITLRKTVLEGRRGRFLDRNGSLLATSVDTFDVGFLPRKVGDHRAVARIAADFFGRDERGLLDRLRSGRYTPLGRKVSPARYDRLKAALGPLAKGLNRDRTWTRSYPERSLASALLGFVNVDNRGIEGLEARLDETLASQKIRVDVVRTGGTDFAEDLEKKTPPPGRDVVLTIDKRIQSISERALEEAVDRYDAESGMAIVLDPSTGEVLAMAQKPDFNPNNPSGTSRQFTNQATRSIFEPGSTMKIFVMARAIDRGYTRPDSLYNCENGRYRIGPAVINDTKPHEWLNTADIIKYSSNIGVTKVAEITGPEFIYETLRDFGFNQPTGIETGEAKGLLRTWSKWRPVDTANAAFGQGYNVTGIQLATATAAIANGGLLMKPYVIREVRNPENGETSYTRPVPRRRVISEQTAGTLREMMREVTREGGTGPLAAPAGWEVGGKTGTAQKIVDGTYSKRDFIASFAGFAPFDNPRLVVLVSVDTPRKSYYGGVVAAPVFRKIVSETLTLLNVPPRPPGTITAARTEEASNETL